MKVLVYPHDLGMGGSQLNAIELAARVRDLGVETMIFGQQGALSERISQLGVDFIESPDPGRRPSATTAALLRRIVRERRIDVLHGYEWPPSLECFAASWGLKQTATVSTVMSMAVPQFIPTSVPLIVGTEQIAEAERIAGRQVVHVIEPPVDLQHNVASSPRAAAEFRQSWDIRPESRLVVCVTRLANELKLEGLISAIAAVSGPLADLPIQLLIVGDGPAREAISAAAQDANRRAGSHRVILTGELRDPRTAYTAADVVVGMGGSALRALAFAKPLVVQGEKGFFTLLTPDSVPQFLWQGWYGVGADTAAGVERFNLAIRAASPAEDRKRLGLFGRRLVEQRFSLDAAAEAQVRVYEHALRQRPKAAETGKSALVSGVRFADYYVKRKVNRWGRTSPSRDDFNANPVAARENSPVASQSLATAKSKGVLVYLAGAPWHAVPGTDAQLAVAVGRTRTVIWVDPPVSIVSRIRRGIEVPAVSQVAPGVTRVHPIAPPGVTRPVIREVASWWSYLLTRHVVRQMQSPIAAVLSSSPEPILARWSSPLVPRIYFATDDFLSGAELLGLSKTHAAESQRSNVRNADVVLAVSPCLVDRLRRPGVEAVLFPNGCDMSRYAAIDTQMISPKINIRVPMAGIIGQLNERLDLDFVEAVVQQGIGLLLVGPRYERDQRFRRRLDSLISSPTVQWVDRLPVSELPGFMAAIKVGLTPYAQTEFNEASFPLKTLEYLSAGRQVVSSPLPANRLLRSDVVHTIATPEEFGRVVRDMVADSSSTEMANRCRAEASAFSWEKRAADLESVITAVSQRRTSAGIMPADYSHREATS